MKIDPAELTYRHLGRVVRGDLSSGLPGDRIVCISHELYPKYGTRLGLGGAECWLQSRESFHFPSSGASLDLYPLRERETCVWQRGLLASDLTLDHMPYPPPRLGRFLAVVEHLPPENGPRTGAVRLVYLTLTPNGPTDVVEVFLEPSTPTSIHRIHEGAFQ